MSEEFKPFQKVLVRDGDAWEWHATFFSHKIVRDVPFPYVTVGGKAYMHCLPYEGNEHLLGTADSPTPTFKWGDHVEVRDDNEED